MTLLQHIGKLALAVLASCSEQPEASTFAKRARTEETRSSIFPECSNNARLMRKFLHHQRGTEGPTLPSGQSFKPSTPSPPWPQMKSHIHPISYGFYLAPLHHTHTKARVPYLLLLPFPLAMPFLQQ